MKVNANYARAKFQLVCLSILALLLTLAACQQALPPQPPDTRAACDESIKGFFAMDAAKWASVYIEDSVLMAPDAPLMHGRAEAQK